MSSFIHGSGETFGNVGLAGISGIYNIFSTLERMSTCLLTSSVVKIFKRVKWPALIF